MPGQKDRSNDAFTYTYSAKKQEAIQIIKEKYLPKNESDLEQLIALDRSVETKGAIASIVFGLIGTMILGTGMSCILVCEGVLFIPGIVIGLLGIAILAAAYPLHSAIISEERQKIAPKILKLAEELEKAQR